MLAFYNVPRLMVGVMTSLDLGQFGTSLVIDAIPAIIILGTVLYPVASAAEMHPVVFAIIGIVSLSFGLVTPPYGLCLLISASIARVNVVNCLRDVSIILAPMLMILLLIILFPEIVLWLPRLLMPGFK